MIWQRIISLRKEIDSLRNAGRFLIGLAFLGFVFSIHTWHLWREHKIALYVWAFCTVGTLVVGLLAPNRDAAFALFVFGGSYVSYGRSWQWFHGDLPPYVPLLWILGTIFVLSIAPKRKLALIAALGMWVLLSLKAVLVDREVHAIVITAIASALIVVTLVTARDGES